MSVHDDLAGAIEAGDVAKVRQLVVEHPELVNSPAWTPPPLHCAVLWNQPQVAEVLLDNGANIEIRDPDRDTTPIEYAVVYCKKDLIPLLLSRGAKTDSSDEGGRTVLQLALDAADGAFEEFDDLPRPAEYNEVVDLLKRLGVE